MDIKKAAWRLEVNYERLPYVFCFLYRLLQICPEGVGELNLIDSIKNLAYGTTDKENSAQES